MGKAPDMGRDRGGEVDIGAEEKVTQPEILEDAVESISPSSYLQSRSLPLFLNFLLTWPRSLFRVTRITRQRHSELEGGSPPLSPSAKFFSSNLARQKWVRPKVPAPFPKF